MYSVSTLLTRTSGETGSSCGECKVFSFAGRPAGCSLHAVSQSVVHSIASKEMRRRPGKRARVEIGTSYTLARWDEQSRRQVGPTILVDRPRPAPPLLLHQISPVGWPLCGGQSRGAMRAGELFKPAPNTQVRTVRKRRTEGSATAAGRAGPGRNRVHRKRSLGGMSRADVRWGPRFSSTAPPSTPIPSSIRFPRGLAARGSISAARRGGYGCVCAATV